MSINDIKGNLSQGGSIDRGSMKEKSSAPQKEDKSFFKGRKEVSMAEANRWIRDPKRYDELKIKESARKYLGDKMLKDKGYYFDQKEAQKIKKELDLGKYGAYKDLPEQEKIGMKIIINKIIDTRHN